jgi:hypothetical protein
VRVSCQSHMPGAQKTIYKNMRNGSQLATDLTRMHWTRQARTLAGSIVCHPWMPTALFVLHVFRSRGVKHSATHPKTNRGEKLVKVNNWSFTL